MRADLDSLFREVFTVFPTEESIAVGSAQAAGYAYQGLICPSGPSQTGHSSLQLCPLGIQQVSMVTLGWWTDFAKPKICCAGVSTSA